MNMDFVSSKMVPNNESTIVAPYIEIKDIHHDHIYTCIKILFSIRLKLY